MSIKLFGMTIDIATIVMYYWVLMGNIQMNTQVSGIGAILKHLKNLAQTHPNKAQLAELCAIRYHRLMMYVGREDAMLWPDELQALADYFGIKVWTDVVPVALTWVPHPANAAFEYEVDGMRRSTGRLRNTATKAIITPAIAAE